MRCAGLLAAVVTIVNMTGLACSPEVPALDDAGTSEGDAGNTGDAGRADAGVADAGVADAGVEDAGVDAGSSHVDAGVDAGDVPLDAGSAAHDGGDNDGGSDDGGAPDPNADADGDTIRDADEGRATQHDSDGDGTPDWLDADADDDCVPDALEAGDALLDTPPSDSDDDGIPNVLDPDSDDDRLADELEDLNCDGVLDDGESSRTSADTDADGADDLIEQVLATDAQDASDNPSANGDLVFVLPYASAPAPSEGIVDAVASPQKVDAYFLLDRSGSLGAELTSLRDGLGAALDAVRCYPLGTGVPGSCTPNLWSGTGGIGYVGSGGESFENYLDLQPDPALTASSINTIEPSSTSFVETQYLALWSVITGDGSEAASCSIADPYVGRSSCAGSSAGEGGLGYPCFRPGAVRAVILLTDEAPSDCLNCPTRQTVAAAAVANGVSVASLNAGGSLVRSDLVELSYDTGTVDSSGTPMVYDVTHTVVSNVAAQALRDLAFFRPLSASLSLEDDPSDAVDATELVASLALHNVTSPTCSDGNATYDSDADGTDDTFAAVAPGSAVCWRMTATENVSLSETDAAQRFSLVAITRTPEGALLDEKDVHFIVPPAAPTL